MNTTPTVIAEQVRHDASQMRKLRQILGYVENSSAQVVTLSIDDATCTYILTVRGYGVDAKAKERRYYGGSLSAVIDAAIAAGEGAE